MAERFEYFLIIQPSTPWLSAPWPPPCLNKACGDSNEAPPEGSVPEQSHQSATLVVLIPYWFAKGYFGVSDGTTIDTILDSLY